MAWVELAVIMTMERFRAIVVFFHVGWSFGPQMRRKQRFLCNICICQIISKCGTFLVFWSNWHEVLDKTVLYIFVWQESKTKNAANRFPIAEFAESLYSLASPRFWIFLHHAWPRWKLQHLILVHVAGKMERITFIIDSSKSTWLQVKTIVSTQLNNTRHTVSVDSFRLPR